jgi:hypothetical protein
MKKVKCKMEEKKSILRFPFAFLILHFAFSRVLCVEKFFLSHTHLQTAIISNVLNVH